ncbi:MAG: YggT family protein [Candidatus Cloacimonetes bacterium]|nr:YggT family protein [Candidatus Cloacimonadota bacterium]
MLLAHLIARLANIYIIIIIVRAIMSWFVQDPRNELYRILVNITEPVLGPIRKIIPIQGIDISPIIAILLIHLVIRLLIGV